MTLDEYVNAIFEDVKKSGHLQANYLKVRIQQAQREAVEKTKAAFKDFLKETGAGWHLDIAEEADDATALIEYLIDELTNITPTKVLGEG